MHLLPQGSTASARDGFTRAALRHVGGLQPHRSGAVFNLRLWALVSARVTLQLHVDSFDPDPD